MALEREGSSGSGWVFTKDMRFAVSEHESHGYRAAFTREGNGKRAYFHVIVVDGTMKPAYAERYADVGTVDETEQGLGFNARTEGETSYSFVLMPKEPTT